MRVGKKGFTLIEMLVVVVIIAVMAAVAVPSVIHYVDEANAKTDATYFEGLSNNIQLGIGKLKNKGIPATLDHLVTEAYISFTGQYNAANPLNSMRGNSPYMIFPNKMTADYPTTGKFCTIGLATVQDGPTLMGNAFELNMYDMAQTDPLIYHTRVVVSGLKFKATEVVPTVAPNAPNAGYQKITAS